MLVLHKSHRKGGKGYKLTNTSAILGKNEIMFPKHGNGRAIKIDKITGVRRMLIWGVSAHTQRKVKKHHASKLVLY